MQTVSTIFQQELDKLKDDIINAYNQSGKKTSGNFEDQLDFRYKDAASVEILGVAYMAGRPAGKMPPVEALEKWVTLKGIASVQSEVSGIAWAIAKKIANEGTRDESHLPIYEMILTPQRIDEIISKVSEFHVARFVEEVTTHIMSISQKYTK